MKAIRLSLLLCGALLLSACGGASLRTVAAQKPNARVAVVSLSINQWGAALHGWEQTYDTPLMRKEAAEMVRYLEGKLGQTFEVVPADSFAGRQDFQALSGGSQFDVTRPAVGEQTMPVFAQDRGQLVRAELPPQAIQQLAQALGVDYVAVVYVEWGGKTGSFVPTSKALAKTVLALHDATGKKVYAGRSDKIGDKTLGAFGHLVVDENSVGQWTLAYQRGVDALTAK